jgi:hypothetical protein
MFLLYLTDTLDGITIFNLTDPQNPGYCHTGRRYETSLGLCELLNGEKYCRTYFYERKAEDLWHPYDEREEDEYQRDERTVVEIVTLLQDENLIDPNVLLNACNMPWCVDDLPVTHSANLKMDSSVGLDEFPSAPLGEGLALIVQRLANYQYTMGFVQFSTT